jgi:hypothetical protein
MTNKVKPNSIYKICKDILKITTKEFKEVSEMALNQAGYIHPLKQATQSRVVNAGKNNLKIIELLMELQDVIKKNRK